MAGTEGQDYGAMFDQLHGQFLVDLNGDGQPDVAVPRTRVAQAGTANGGVTIDPNFDYNAFVEAFGGKKSQKQIEHEEAMRVMRKLYSASKPAPEPKQPAQIAPPQFTTESMPPQPDAVQGYAGRVVERGTIVPAGTYEDGVTRWALPGIINEPIDGFNRLMQAVAGNDYEAAGKAAGPVGASIITGAIGGRALGKNPLMEPAPIGPPGRGALEGVPNVYQKPGAYHPNEIKSPSGPTPPELTATPREMGMDFYTDLYRGDRPGEGGRALVDRIGSNKANIPIFKDTKKFAPYSLAELQARVRSGDKAAAAEIERRFQSFKETGRLPEGPLPD